MSEFHFIKNEKVRETLQVILAAIGVIGVVVAILSFVY